MRPPASLRAVLRVARELGHHSRCPACGKLILIEHDVVWYRRHAHHAECVVYRRRARKAR